MSREEIAIIREEAEECAKSSVDFRNARSYRDAFHVMSVVLGNLAKELDKQQSQHGGRGT